MFENLLVALCEYNSNAEKIVAVSTNKIINEMKNRNANLMNKTKSPEVKGQEQKVEENEKQVQNEEYGSDGEIL